ncbi:MAG: hypothetical protein M3461_06465 [Pseudomonadota bacterium]|nr:hypothetical protein [Pseudomonadota bacterium]
MSKLKYGMARASAIGAIVGVAALSLPEALAQQPMGTSEDTMDQQSYNMQRGTREYEIQKQECDTLKYNQPQSYEPCLQKAKATRDNLLAQGSEQAGQGSQGSASNQPGQSGQKQGPIEKVTSVVKEKLVDWGLASPGQGGGGQTGAGQQGQGAQQGAGQGLQASFNRESPGAGSGQGGQAGQQGLTQGQQFQGQQGQSGQGSFQGGNFGQQPQGQSASQQFQSGGTQGQGTAEVRDYPTPSPQGSSSQQTGSTTGSTGAEEEHMDSVEYYQELARRQYGTLKQECDALKRDPTVWEQCQTYAKSIRDKITGMAEENQGGG